jgi:hypothetical protein
MALKQVITIGPDGVITGLDRKKGEGIDLKKFGKVSVVRASQIEWHEGNDFRGYKIEFLTGPRSGTTLTVNEYGKYHNNDLPSVINPEGGEDFALFEDYGESVKVEVFVLDSDRLKGIF